MDKEYFIGIDFGHGETSVSRVPGYNKETVSRVPLRITGHDVDKKVVSALCKHDDGWHFVWSQEDFKRPEIREGFKGMIGKLEPVRKEALGEFAKLVFRTILKNDEDLVYNEATGEANFSICIACPSDWRRQDPQTPQDYLEFFRDECGITPIEMCINESDAAFYTKYNDYSSDDTIFVIDLGSSTIDFTTYHHSECISDCCWGHNLGAHIVEDKIIETGYEDQDNEKNMRKAAEARRNAKLGSADAALSLAARFAKEKFYTNHLSEFEFEVRFSHLIPAWPSKREVAFSLFLSKEEFNHVIQDYSKQLESVFMNAAKKLSNYGIEPSLVLLSGGASRMDFVRDSAEKAFPNAQIYHDNCPEWVVSDGAAKYCNAQLLALEELLNRIKAIDYKSIYKDADITATQEATKALIPTVINKITGPTNYTGLEMLQEFCEFFFELNSQNLRYVDLFTEAANLLLKEKISKAIKDVIFNAFKVIVDMSDISLQYDFQVMNWQPEFWMPTEQDGEVYIGQGCKIVMQAIEDSSGRYDFTWDRKREQTERKKIAEGCRVKFSGRDPFGVQFDEESLKDAAAAICFQSLKIAEKLFHEKELFRTSNYR